LHVTPMRVLFLENDDSFSWNVIDRLPVPRSQVSVCSGRDRAAWQCEMSHARVVVIGPGPMDPERAGLDGLVAAAAARGLPVLGICLGHQAIGRAYGARLERTEPCHGKRATAVFRPSRSFPAVRGPLEVMRYHSLALAGVQPPLSVVATTPDGIVMAVEHETLPIAGLQFHPDSFGTPRGAELLAAFFGSMP
jgi:anthranilate synthase/aminodeoxychorismate synthase-like glutamine amidotransferase